MNDQIATDPQIGNDLYAVPDDVPRRTPEEEYAFEHPNATVLTPGQRLVAETGDLVVRMLRSTSSAAVEAELRVEVARLRHALLEDSVAHARTHGPTVAWPGARAWYLVVLLMGRATLLREPSA